MERCEFAMARWLFVPVVIIYSIGAGASALQVEVWHILRMEGAETIPADVAGEQDHVAEYTLRSQHLLQ